MCSAAREVIALPPLQFVHSEISSVNLYFLICYEQVAEDEICCCLSQNEKFKIYSSQNITAAGPE